jgi:hypothetical protein
MESLQNTSDDIDLGITEYETPSVTPQSSSTPSSSDIANVRQQKEYVGVSRATDTVTIISNNVKKEGSPLGTLAQANSNTINSEESRSNNEAQVISATIAPYFNTS